MKKAIIESYVLLMEIEFLMIAKDLRSIHERVKRQGVLRPRGRSSGNCADLCHAMDLACVFYIRRALCLQRSAATTILLRRHGIPAEMVIGAQLFPFSSHAWVEVDRVVVNDKPYMAEMYLQLERC